MRYSRIRFVGDIHANANALVNAMQTAPENTLVMQVGDFGVGFFSPEQDEVVKDLMQNANVRFIRGNHDCPSQCANYKGWLPDYSTIPLKTNYMMMGIGGAMSEVRDIAKKDIEWWDDEELSIADGYAAFEVYEKQCPMVVVTHDGPQNIVEKMFPHKTLRPTRTRQLFNQIIAESHLPEVWVFGHHHPKGVVSLYFEDCLFVCVPIDQYFDFIL